MSADYEEYWTPLSNLRSELRCWVRFSGFVRIHPLRVGGIVRLDGRWGLMLGLPMEGYLEGPDGPIETAGVEWVEFSTERPTGGIRGCPLSFVDIKCQLLAKVSAMPHAWELRQATWSMERVFDEVPVEVVRFPNPFWRVHGADVGKMS